MENDIDNKDVKSKIDSLKIMLMRLKSYYIDELVNRAEADVNSLLKFTTYNETVAVFTESEHQFKDVEDFKNSWTPAELAELESKIQDNSDCASSGKGVVLFSTKDGTDWQSMNLDTTTTWTTIMFSKRIHGSCAWIAKPRSVSSFACRVLFICISMYLFFLLPSYFCHTCILTPFLLG